MSLADIIYDIKDREHQQKIKELENKLIIHEIDNAKSIDDIKNILKKYLLK